MRLDLFRLDIRHMSILRIINCWNNSRAEMSFLSRENIAVLCCKRCCSLIMAFGFKMGDNGDSVSMEEVKINDNIDACLLFMKFIKSHLHSMYFFFQNYWQKPKFPFVISLHFFVLFCNIHSAYSNLEKQLFEKELIKNLRVLVSNSFKALKLERRRFYSRRFK